jgi:hypothetical protein
VLYLWAIELGELGPTGRAVVVVPGLAPAPIPAQPKPDALEMVGVLDAPLFRVFGVHADNNNSLVLGSDYKRAERCEAQQFL